MIKNGKVIIRKACVTDIQPIIKIILQLDWFSNLRNQTLDVIESRMTQHLIHCHRDDSHTVLVAEDSQGEIAGYTSVHWLPYLVLLQGQEGFVSELFVLESMRGKKIGTMLLEAAKEEALKRGCSRLMLSNGRNSIAYKRGFYSKLGWKEREEIANFVFPLSH